MRTRQPSTSNCCLFGRSVYQVLARHTYSWCRRCNGTHAFLSFRCERKPILALNGRQSFRFHFVLFVDKMQFISNRCHVQHDAVSISVPVKFLRSHLLPAIVFLTLNAIGMPIAQATSAHNHTLTHFDLVTRIYRFYRHYNYRARIT